MVTSSAKLSVIDWNSLNSQMHHQLLLISPFLINQFPLDLILKLPDYVVVDLICTNPQMFDFLLPRLQKKLSVETFPFDYCHDSNLNLLLPHFNWDSISPNEWIESFSHIEAIQQYCPYKGFGFKMKTLLHRIVGES